MLFSRCCAPIVRRSTAAAPRAHARMQMQPRQQPSHWNAPTRRAQHTQHTKQQQQAAADNDAPLWRRRLLLGVGLGLGGLGAASLLGAEVAALSPQPCAARARSTASWPPPILSNEKIYAALRSPVESQRSIERGSVRELHLNQYAANAAIEDSFAVEPRVQAPEGGMLLGVFDGHSGREASRWCSEELLPYLQYYRWSNRTPALLHPRAFLEADHHFLELALRDRRFAAGLSGACVTVSHVAGRTVRTANAGDCRAIIGRRVPRSAPAADGSTHKWQAVELTTDHQIDTNHLERERLLREHPDEADIIQRNRVKGRLQPTRGFSDGFYKRKEFFHARSLSKPYAQWTPPYTTAEPDITEYELQAGDEFMVMASDGLFQDLNSQQVVEKVGEWLSLHSAESARKGKLSLFSGSANPLYTPNCSTWLIRQALQHASEHAVGRRRKENENLSWILQLPQESKRSYHDDLTVAVVFFEPNAAYPSDGAELSPAGPAVPPTLARALSLGIKPPPPPAMPLPSNDGTVPIVIPPQQQQQPEQIRANL